MHIPEGEYFTKRQAAVLLEVDISTLQNYLKNDLLPAIKIQGMGYLINREDVVKLVKPVNGRPPLIR